MHVCLSAVIAIALLGFQVQGAEKDSGKTVDANALEQYGPAVDAIADAISNSDKKTKDLLDDLTQSTNGQATPLITKEILKNMLNERSAKTQKAGTRSISLQAEQGFNGFSNYQPSGWVMTETVGEPDKMKEEAKDAMPVYVYPMGVGPVLMNGCTGASYPKTSKCYSSKVPGKGNTICLNLLDAAAYIGVGFDGRGFYKIESRKASLVQRYCSSMATFMDKDVPDTMNVFGIFETTAETKSFRSADEYMSYIRDKAGLSEQRNLFLSEAHQHSTSKASGFNLGAIGGIVGGAIGAIAGGPAGAALGATLGGAVGGSISHGKGESSGDSSTTTSSQSASKNSQYSQAARKQGSTEDFFAIMYVSVIMYKISLDDVKPNDINFAALRDYMSLPESYFSVGAASKFQDFLLRWGTHFIRSGKFGGQLKITKRAKTNNFASSEEFASLAETEFQSMFSSLQSKHSQETTRTGFLGLGGKKTTTRKSSRAKSKSQHRSTRNERNQESHSSSDSEFTQTTVEAQGGTPEIAEALVDFYTPAFKELYHRWIASINDYVKPFEFKLKPIDQLFDMNMDDLFPAGNRDFGCIGSAGSKVNILTEPKTRRRYYLDEETYFANNKSKTKLVKIYCKYKNQQDFKNALKRRRFSLEKAVAAYMTEGPFPTSSHELKAGQPGCESSTLAKIDVFNSNNNTLTFLQLKKAQFFISFDLPQDIPNLLKSQAKYVMTYLKDRWFATEPGHHHAHLYEGCQLEGFKPAETKICIWSIILTYEEETGFFHIDPLDFIASKRRNPNLPDWIEGTTVARASRIEGQKGTDSTDAASIPCNVRWLNSHRLDPGREENCLYFTAATAEDIFVIFASIPRDHTTWYYLQINMDGVIFYKAMKPQKRDYQKGMGTLGDKNLYQSYFLCVNQANGSVLMQFGKAGSNSEIGTVYSGYKFRPDSQYSRLSFYTFGAGSKSVSLMDIHLTKEMPQVECLNSLYKLVDGHCLLDCHKECIDCNLAKDDTSCFQCRNVHVELWHSIRGKRVRTVRCLPECPAGYQLSDSKENLCVPCQSGTSKNTTGNHNCLPCAPGTFSALQASVKCTHCSPGTFASKPGSAQCHQCQVGTASSFNGSTSCAACSSGWFAAQRGQTECTPCPVGQFNNAEGQTRCQLCSAGFFADKQGQKNCTACPAGTSSAEGSVSCANNCKRGEFSPAKGIPCTKCPAGSFTPSSGSISCSSCAEGSYSNRTGSASCSPCPRGLYQPLTNQTHCKSAKPGWYVNPEGRSEQKMCPLGKISGAAASECTACPAGTFAKQLGSTNCTQCPVGSWSNAGSASCITCSAGTIAKQLGSTNCTQCPAGSWSNAGSADCKLCKAGSFSLRNAPSCTVCPSGTFAKQLGSTKCTQCPAGSWSNTGSASCTACPPGTFAKQLGSKNCTQCPAGWISRGNAADCDQCRPGSRSNADSTNCELCRPGTFAEFFSATKCFDCPAGSYTGEFGSRKCNKDCDQMFYQSLRTGMTHCDTCPYNGATLYSKKCYRKLHLKWCNNLYNDANHIGVYELSSTNCEPTIDNDVSTYGGLNVYNSMNKGKFPSQITYEFERPETVKGFIVWIRIPYDVSSCRKLILQIIRLENGKEVFWRTQWYIDTSLLYRPYQYGYSDKLISNVKAIKVSPDPKKCSNTYWHISFAEIAVYGE